MRGARGLSVATRPLRDLVDRFLPGGRDPADALAGLDGDSDRTLTAPALEALELERQPFSDHTPPDALFLDDALRMQRNVLHDQLTQGQMLSLLKGERGSGKTSLLIQLMAASADTHHCFVVRGAAGVTAQRAVVDMLRVLTRPVPDDPATCFCELARRLRTLVADGRPAVLVIDSADALPDVELNHLLAVHDSLNRSLGGQFRLLLAAEPAFELRIPNLRSRQLDAGQIAATSVRPFQRPRVGAYLQHRLAQAGYAGTTALPGEDLDRIAACTDGLPRPIEAAAAALLNHHYSP